MNANSSPPGNSIAVRTAAVLYISFTCNHQHKRSTEMSEPTSVPLPFLPWRASLTEKAQTRPLNYKQVSTSCKHLMALH